MSIPVKQSPHSPAFQAASDKGTVFEATLEDGTILWIPKVEENKDHLDVLAWADAENLAL